MAHLWKQLIVLTLAAWLPCAPSAQQLLDIQEITRPSGKPHPQNRRGVGIVDINSQLEIRPDRDAIRLRALELTGQAAQGQALTERLRRIENILRNQQRIIDYINQTLSGADVPADSLLQMLLQMTGEISQDSVLRPEFNRFNQEFNQRLRQDRNFGRTNDRFLYALGRFNDQLDSINRDLRALESAARVKFSLRAFRKDKSGGARLHITNFDQFAEGEFFNVDKWVLSFSPEQIQQLQNYRDLADTLNLGAQAAIASFKNQLFGLLPALDCIGTMPAEFLLAVETVPADARAIIDQSLTDVNARIEEIKNELVNLSPGQSFDIQQQLNAARVNLDTIFQQTQRSLLNLPQSNEHLRNIRDCAQQTLDDVKKIQGFVAGFPANYLQKIYLASDTLADEVLAFALDEIPEIGTLDLQYTGRREPGDEIRIEALFVPVADSTNRSRNFTVIETRELKMIHVGAHSDTKIGLLMAQPYTLDDPDASKFRFAPSAAVLLKFGNRHSHFYNNFLNPGIGIVTSSPDFDRDGIPEFAVGLTGTLFRDILSLGWSWNVGADKPFYFLGVHLPFNLPGLPVSPTQSFPPPDN
ncbi:MAG: hypothetical protein JNK89_06020 [Saprospiraceae bacterium]|nr:hypothetical protein [Saprospiraceae bacterium]